MIKYFKWIMGIAAGAALGFSYWYFIGCYSGCAITSSPFNSTVYGGLIGMLLINPFSSNQRKNSDNTPM
jgi:hypothetical protein